jgi:hypothetical protein
MKLRLQGSTLRLRLRRSEIERLAAAGRIEETVQFDSGVFVYSLVLDESASIPHARLTPGEISVRLPKPQGLAWCNSADTGIASTSVVPSILVERDFVRSAVEEPDDFDRFTNPRSGRTPPSPH